MNPPPAPSEHAGNSFDFLRVVAAWAVLYSHSFALIGLPEPEPVAGQSFGSLAVAVFFAISGFLVCQSWIRDPNIGRFAAKRALRIMPGLFVVVVFTALVMGPIYSTLPMLEYLSTLSTWSYIPRTFFFQSVPALPGLFENNLFPNANNGSLWTLRYEVLMYACLALTGYILPRKLLKAGCLGALTLFGLLWIYLIFNKMTPFKMPIVWRIGTEFYGERICYLGVFFFCGCCLNLYIRRIPLSLSVSTALLVMVALVPDKRWAMPLLWIAVPYAAIAFAYRAPKIFQKINGHDYSYGIYIYAFPVQQVLAQVMPNVAEYWFIYLLSSTLITVVLAYCSWTLVERPALGFKDKLIRRPSGGGAKLSTESGRPDL